jgi:tetratricopeptide (TPR) repeat protein
VARPVDTVRGLARFLGLDEPSVSGRVVKATAVNETKLALARRLLAPREPYWEKSLDTLAPTEAADYATDEASTRAEIKKLTAELNEIGELLNQIAEVTEKPDLFVRGVQLSEAGDRDGAAEAWLAYLESTDNCEGRAADAHYNLGVFFDERGELDVAGRMYAGALTCAPAHESALQNAGANAINRGDAVSAVAFFERAYALNPSDVHASNLAVAKERASFVVDDDGK